MTNLYATMAASVALACKALDDLELAGLNLAISFGSDPRNLPQYAKIAYLFTEADGTKMHTETRRAFEAVVYQRLVVAAARGGEGEPKE